MMRPILIRIPEHAYENLVTFCAKQTIETGRRVTQRAVVEQALAEYLARGKQEKTVVYR